MVVFLSFFSGSGVHVSLAFTSAWPTICNYQMRATLKGPSEFMSSCYNFSFSRMSTVPLECLQQWQTCQTLLRTYLSIRALVRALAWAFGGPNPKSRNTKNTVSTQTFRGARTNFCLLSCVMEPNRFCPAKIKQKLVQMNFFFLGGGGSFSEFETHSCRS